jgi:hypothetical protein
MADTSLAHPPHKPRTRTERGRRLFEEHSGEIWRYLYARVSEKTLEAAVRFSPLQGFEVSGCIPRPLATRRACQATLRPCSKGARLKNTFTDARGSVRLH